MYGIKEKDRNMKDVSDKQELVLSESVLNCVHCI